jgi:hypothetical protein
VIPDVTVWRDPARRLAVEIFVTHSVDDVKLAKLQTMNLACVEYDLSNLDRDVTYEHLRTALSAGSVTGRWVYSRRIREAERKAELQRRRAAEEAEKDRQKRAREDRIREDRFFARLRSASVTKDVQSSASRKGEPRYHAAECPMQIRSVDAQNFFANVELDCTQCRFCAGIIRKSSGSYGVPGEPLRVRCAGLVPEARALWPMNEWRDPAKMRQRLG